MDTTVSYIFSFFTRLLPLIAGLGLLIAGIMITAGKEKSVKVLGIGYIIQSLSAIISSCLTLAVRMVSVRLFATASLWSSYAEVILNVGYLLCVCIFIHRNYGKKLIYIPVLAVSIGGLFISRVVLLLLFRVISVRNDSAMWISMTQQINNFVIGAAVALIIIIVFYLNRKKEGLIPKAWLFMSIALGGAAFRTLIYVIYYLSQINKFRVRGPADGMLSMTIAFTALLAVITPVYITTMVYKGRKEPDQA